MAEQQELKDGAIVYLNCRHYRVSRLSENRARLVPVEMSNWQSVRKDEPPRWVSQQSLLEDGLVVFSPSESA